MAWVLAYQPQNGKENPHFGAEMASQGGKTKGK